MPTPRRVGPDFAISTQNDNTQDDSAITVLRDGRTVVTWFDFGSNSGDIKSRIFNADGTPAGPEKTVNTGTAGLQTAPSITALAGGGYVMAWEDYRSDASGNIAYRVFGADGAALTGVRIAHAIQSGLQQDPSVTALGDGGFAIGWTDHNKSANGLDATLTSAAMLRRFDAAGLATGAAIRISGDLGGDDGPELASTGFRQGGISSFAVWDDELGPDATAIDQDGIYARMIGPPFASGNYTDGGTRIDTQAEFQNDAQNPDIAAFDAASPMAVVWDDMFSESDGRDVYISIDGKVRRVNTVTEGDQEHAAVAALADGSGYVVVWETFNGPSSYDVKARTFNLEGGATSGEFLINSSANPAFANTQDTPDVVGLIDGRFQVTFSDPGNGGISAAIFDPRTAATDWQGTAFAEQFRATLFNDVVSGQGGNDSLFGDAGNDRLAGDAGNDTLGGGTGNDSLVGGAGNDRLFGDAGSDTFLGGTGKDVIDGGAGKDLLRGQGGNDTFLFSSRIAGANADRIDDFNGVQDRIGLENTVFTDLGNRITSTEFRLGTGARDSNDHLIYDRATGRLFYDDDGNGNHGKVLIATLDANTALGFGDFVLV